MVTGLLMPRERSSYHARLDRNRGHGEPTAVPGQRWGKIIEMTPHSTNTASHSWRGVIIQQNSFGKLPPVSALTLGGGGIGIVGRNYHSPSEPANHITVNLANGCRFALDAAYQM
jgi:hypothetical protein